MERSIRGRRLTSSSNLERQELKATGKDDKSSSRFEPGFAPTDGNL